VGLSCSSAGSAPDRRRYPRERRAPIYCATANSPLETTSIKPMQTTKAGSAFIGP
jgi:hypothetical protein